MDRQRLSKALVVVVPSSKDGPEEAYRNLRDAVSKYPDRLGLMAGGAILGTMLEETGPKDVNDKIKAQFRKDAERVLNLSMRVPSKGVDNSGRPIPNRITDPNMKIKAEWKKLIEDFPDRMMLGADEFIGPGAEKVTLAASFETTWALVDQLPEKLSAQVGWENAKHVYRLK